MEGKMGLHEETRVTVIGLGYVGLPCAAMLANAGCKVTGMDINPEAVRTINEGDIHIRERGLDILVRAAVQRGNLRASTQIHKADVYIIAVPTPITPDKSSDITIVLKAVESVAEVLERGQMVIIESTCPPLTCENHVGPFLKQATGLDHGVDYDLVYCPERLLPGSIVEEIVQNDRVVGGTSDVASERAARLYAKIETGQILKTDATTAEMVKLM